MTFYKRDLLERVGEDIQDPQLKQSFNSILRDHKFSSDKQDAVTYEGQFQHDLTAAGLGDVANKLAPLYTKQILRTADLDR